MLGSYLLFLLSFSLFSNILMFAFATSHGFKAMYLWKLPSYLHKNHQRYLNMFGKVSSVEVICFNVGCDFSLPLVTIVQQLLLVIQQLLVGLRGELKVGSLHDGVHGAGLLAEPAVDTLGHVDVVSGGSPCAIAPLLGLNSNSLKGNFKSQGQLIWQQDCESLDQMIYLPGQDRRPHRACRQCTSPHHWHTCILHCANNWVLGTSR